MLAQRPDWQERLRTAFARVGDDVAAIESGKDIPEAEWFLYEIERMYPSALFFPRIPLEDTLRERPPAPGSHGVLMAMGPGFCSELVLLRAAS